MAATWICCNSCFASASTGNELAVSTCRHIICSRCFKKGNVQQGQCGICKAKCHLSLISDKSSPDVKALFTDLGSTATKYFSEIKGVLQFQARQQKRLLTHYQQRSQNLEETVMKMKQEIQELNKKISQQNMYIHKLESSAHQRTGHAEPDAMSMFYKPEARSPKLPRLSVISPPQDGSIGTVPHRVSPAHSATVSLSGSLASRCLAPDGNFGSLPHLGSIHPVRPPSVSGRDFSCGIKTDSRLNQSMSLMTSPRTQWETPVFKAPFRYSSMSSLH